MKISWICSIMRLTTTSTTALNVCWWKMTVPYRLYKRNKRWHFSFSIDGKQVRKSTCTGDEELAHRYAQLIYDRAYLSTWGRIIDRYKTEILNDTNFESLEWLNFYLNDYPIKEIATLKVVQQLRNLRLLEGASKVIVNQTMSILKDVFDKCFWEWKLLSTTLNVPIFQFMRKNISAKTRYEIIKRDGGKCVVCGRTPEDGIKLQVDHIKPVSKYPELQLDTNHMQTFCDECNIGKGNRDEIDWRNR